MKLAESRRMAKRNCTSRETGDFHEALAALHLRKLGWRILASQVRYRVGEIDLVAEEPLPDRGWALVFVEVRSRGAGFWVSPEESVKGVKLMRLRRAVTLYLAGYRGRACEVRIDLIAFRDGVMSHYKNIRSD
jgi:putative endonuclease